jgi:hypothetical protein
MVGAEKADQCAPNVFAAGDLPCGFKAVLLLPRSGSACGPASVPKDGTAFLSTGQTANTARHAGGKTAVAGQRSSYQLVFYRQV